MYKIVKRFSFILLLILSLTHLYSTPELRLSTAKGPEFEIGDIFEVKLDLSGNNGAYGVYADIRYNDMNFELMDIYPGGLLPEVENKSEFLTALSAFNEQGRILISNSLVGEQPLFSRDGTIARLVFKAVRAGSDKSISLFADNSGIYLNAMQTKAVTLAGLTGLKVIGPYSNYFVQIIAPYNNYKTTENKLDFQVQATIKNPGYNDEFKVGLKKVQGNDTGEPICTGTEEFFLPVDAGYAFFSKSDDHMFRLEPGYNYIVAALYVNNEVMAQAIKQVYYEVLGRGVKITSPADNSIVSKSRLVITGESTFPKVTINNRQVATQKAGDTLYRFVYETQKLKEGFNKITARTVNESEPDVIYQDTVIVYYQQDESIFDFLEPEQNTVYKSGIINLKGVIDTIETDVVLVRLRAYFKPYGNGNDYFYVFKDTDQPESDIQLSELADSDNYLLSHYVFKSQFDTALLDGYGSGVLTFYAVKIDKKGENQPIEISRSVVIDTQALKIDLEQPNLFSQESLQNKADLTAKGYLAQSTGLTISDNVQVALDKKAEQKNYTDAALNQKNIKTIIQTADQYQYAVVNTQFNTFEIYQKAPNADNFDPNSKREYVNAHANSAVEFGSNNLLVAISDYNQGTNHPAGLVLFNNHLLKTAKLPFTINHIQFIERVGSSYFLYSSNSDYLYRFEEADTVIDKNNNQYFEIKKIKKFYLSNNVFIHNLKAVNAGETILLSTEMGINIYRYNETAQVYNRIKIIKSGYDILQLECAALESSYNVYLFAYKDNLGKIQLGSLTEYNGKFTETEIGNPKDYDAVYQIIPAGNNRFVIYANKSGVWTLQQAEVFYQLTLLSQNDLSGLTGIQDKPGLLYIDERNYSFYGSGILNVSDEYLSTPGVLELVVQDSAVDGLYGFSYDAQSIYEDLLTVEYLLTNDPAADDYSLFNKAGVSIPDSALSRYQYEAPVSYQYLKIRFTLHCNPAGFKAPMVENITVRKKEIVKTTINKLDIKGFILDKTVLKDAFTVNSNPVAIEDNGSFFTTIEINDDQNNDETSVLISADNRKGEHAEIRFNVVYVDNEPQLDQLLLMHGTQTKPLVKGTDIFLSDAANDFNPIAVTSETIGLSGTYSGLMGVQVTADVYTLDAQGKLLTRIRSYNARLENAASGNFAIDNVEMIPGNQRVLLRCKNPYGKQEELKLDLNYQAADQKVIITNYELSGNKISQVFNVEKNTVKQYIKTIELTGRVITDKPVDAINFRSDNPYITFTKLADQDVSYIKVNLIEPAKTFSVYVNLKMNDAKEHLEEYFKMWPDSLQLFQLSRNITMEFNKIFNNIKPDFTPTEFDPDTGNITLKFKFNEQIPQNMLMRLRFNHQDLENTPYLVLTKETANLYFTYQNGIYTYKKTLNALNGNNIIDWWFYQDQGMIGEYDNDKLLGFSGNLNYLSYAFDNEEVYKELIIKELDDRIFYDLNTLSSVPLQVNFDDRGVLTFKLNDNSVDLSSLISADSVLINLADYQTLIRQGINQYSFYYAYPERNIEIHKTYEFKYDSIAPVVEITNIDYVNDFVNPFIKSITCQVTEDNLKSVNLFYKGSSLKVEPVIRVQGDNIYIFEWNNLTANNILPSAQDKLYIEARDITNKSGMSKVIEQGLSLYYDIQLSNNLTQTKVLNHPEITPQGTDDSQPDFSSYRNEQDNSFTNHLKYTSTQQLEGSPLRDEITSDNFSKETIFNTDHKYLMFEYDNAADAENFDIGYRRIHQLTKNAAVMPVNQLEHLGYTNLKYGNSFNLGVDTNNNPVYSVVQGYRVPEPQDANYVGRAADIETWDNYALVLDLLDQNKDGIDDYKAIVIYELTRPDIISNNAPNVPDIKFVLDEPSIMKIVDFKIFENYLYANCADEGILIYNLSTLNTMNKPSFVSRINTVNVADFTVVKDSSNNKRFIYLACAGDGINVCDISDIAYPYPSSPIMESSPQYSPVAIIERNGILYTVTNDKKLIRYQMNGTTITPLSSSVIDIIDPEKPVLWFEDNLLCILPAVNSVYKKYNLDLTFNSNGFICMNKPVDNWYPTADSIFYKGFKSWGNNRFGKLGDLTTIQKTNPIFIPGLSNVKQITGGEAYTVALLEDGTVKAWGLNSYGQLGDGTTTMKFNPVIVSELSNVKQIACGRNHTASLLNDGTVRVWGNNSSGQIGDGSKISKSSPVAINGLSNVKQIECGDYHTVVLLNDGTVKAWGNNSSSQLGLGDSITADQVSPVTIPGLNNVKQIACGSYFTLALLNDGTVKAWGLNSNGQLGDGTQITRTSPVTITGLTDGKQISCGSSHSFALLNNGTVKAWGYNYNGQLGDGTRVSKTAPVLVPGLSNVSQIDCGDAHTILLFSDETVKTFGNNDYGQLGDGTITRQISPVLILNLTGIKQIACGRNHSIALQNDGTVKSWGDNSYGQLGDVTLIQKTNPIVVSGITNVKQIACGNDYVLALLNNGTIRAWGYNGNGQLGDGSTVTPKISPVSVTGLTDVKQVASGYVHSVALLNNGSVMAWGSNESGQLGDGTTVYKTSPVLVPNLGNVKQITCGAYFTFALLNDGMIKAWGNNIKGQLGDETTQDQHLPVTISGVTNVKQIACGYLYTVALLNDGTLKAWGYNDFGQLGDGTTSTTPVTKPIIVPGINNVKQIACGKYHTIALLKDGTLKAWGNNDFGQLGDGTTTLKNSPINVPGISNVKQIACGSYYTLALLNDGTIKAWGNNDYGQLGDGTTGLKTSPVAVPGITTVSQIACGYDYNIVLLDKESQNNYKISIGNHRIYSASLSEGIKVADSYWDPKINAEKAYYTLPLSHAAYKVDIDLTKVKNNMPLGIYSRDEGDFKMDLVNDTVSETSKTNKKIIYYDIQAQGVYNPIKNAFNAFNENLSLGSGLMDISFNKTYFTDRINKYIEGQCLDDQIGNNEYPLSYIQNLTLLNTRNHDNFINTFNAYFDKRPNQDIILGEKTDELILGKKITGSNLLDVNGFDPAKAKIYLTDNLAIEPYTSGERISEKTRKEIFLPRKKTGAISFWLRLEEELPYFKNYTELDPAKRFWKDYNDVSTARPIISWGNNSENSLCKYRFVLKTNPSGYDSLAFVQYNNNNTLNKADTEITAALGTPIKKWKEDNDYGTWHLVTLNWDTDGGLTLYFNTQKINETPVIFNNFDFDSFIKDRIIFGDTGQDTAAFYYSIASPKVYNRLLTDDDIQAIHTSFNRLQGNGTAVKMTFDGSLDLVKPADAVDEVSTNTAVYEKSINGEAFVTTKGITNYLSGDLANKNLMLTDAFTYEALIKQNITADYDAVNNSLTFTLLSGGTSGTYHLTDGTGTGLGIPGAESYTFFGTVISPVTKNNTCIIKINGVEKQFSLKTGDFKFTYSGVSGQINDIDIYFILNENVSFKADGFGFNTGRYKGNELTGYPDNYVRLKHKFHYKESVVVYYQPLFENEWELNNQEIVILDSRIYKIGIRNNRYYAVLKTLEGEKILTSDDKITGGLHQLAVIYDFSALTYKFYMDAKLEGEYQGGVFTLPYDINLVPAVYTAAIGGSMDDLVKSQGMIDQFEIYPDVILEGKLTEDFRLKTNMISITEAPVFGQSHVTLILKNNLSGPVTLNYTFDKGNTVPLTIDSLSQAAISGDFTIGAHQLKMVLQADGIRKTEIYNFYVNYAPYIRVLDSKSMIIRGDNHFVFRCERDVENSYAEQNAFIELKLYLSDDPVITEDELAQVIKEDVTNRGKYYRDNQYTTLSNEIVFDKQYIPGTTGTIYYRIKAYYKDNDANYFIINNSIKILDMKELKIDYDPVNNRPWQIKTGIYDFDSSLYNTNGLKCNYEILKLNPDLQVYESLTQGKLLFNDQGEIILNVYNYAEAGNYKVVITPADENGNQGTAKDVVYGIIGTGGQPSDQNPVTSGSVHIDELVLLFVDKVNNSVKYTFSGGVENLPADDRYTVEVFRENLDTKTVTGIYNEELTTAVFNKVINIPELTVGTHYRIIVKAVYQDKTASLDHYFTYTGVSLEVKLTHGPKGVIGYNNIYFNWEGKLNSQLSHLLKYYYQLDGSAWNETADTHIEFYNLTDGYHTFTLQGFYGEEGNRSYSGVTAETFTIDTRKPILDTAKIAVEEIRGSDGIISHLKVIAAEGTVTDLTLMSVTVNNITASVNKGAFTVDEIPLETDGTNFIEIIATDVLGNISKAVKEIDFDVLGITYPPTISNFQETPSDDLFVKYSPLTVYGTISDKIRMNDNVKIYADDPYGRRNAVINFDRTFFIENVKINPGSEFKAIRTDLHFIIDLGNGKTLKKIYPVYARDVVKPVELDLSVHAVAGGAETTEVKMTAYTGIKNIACWSFDYDGDGIYEDDYFTGEKEKTVFYKYSTVGQIHPRVRAITQDGHIFSGEDTLIIHDKILKADLKTIKGVKSIDIIEIDDPADKTVDGYEQVYLLHKINQAYVVKRYMIEANSAVLLDNSSVYANLNQLGINYPRQIKAEANGTIYISALYGEGSRLYKLNPVTGAYVLDKTFNLVLPQEVIAGFAIDQNTIYLTLENTNEILKYTKHADFISRQTCDVNDTIENIGNDAGLDAGQDKLWIADSRKQRVVMVTKDTLQLRDFFGEAGDGEGQFISPKIIRVKDNFIFVMDQSVKTLQVFEQVGTEYRIVSRLTLQADYLPDGFLNDISDFSVFTKMESKKRYYYLCLVNNNWEQAALLRIPQWQPNSIKAKSNLVCYMKNNEIFLSKPDGADCKKIFSSGSLPGIDGNVDFPSLGPDGTTVVFVSRIEKYEALPAGGTVFRKYDKLYTIDVDGTNCQLISDPLIGNKEIDRPQFSYNGSKIIFSAKGTGEYWTIYEYDIPDKTLKKIFEPSNDCMRPTYSPNDRYIAYVTKFESHNEIIIYDTENPDLVIPLTHNDYSDDYPVWSPVYPGEISNTELNIKSKIAFVSKPGFQEKIFYTYIRQASFGDFAIVKASGATVSGNPDEARNEPANLDYTNLGTVSYPCFTGDGQTLILETYKEGIAKLVQYNLKTKTCTETGIPAGARHPAGMKNSIVNFTAVPYNGNCIKLNWDRFAKEELLYTVQFISNENDATWEERTFKSQNCAVIEDVKMGLTYTIRVYVKDLLRDDEITSSVWKNLVIFPVIARPTITIDPNNPYLVKMQAWKPETDKPWSYNWKFRWFIDNYEVKETFSNVFEYEFGTSGVKRITLEAYPEGDGSKVHRSEDHLINILGNLKPEFSYNITNTSGIYNLELDASASSGIKIDRSSYKWTISGSNLNGNLPNAAETGEKVIKNISNYSGNIYVTLSVASLPVTGQIETIREEKSFTRLIPLGYDDIRPSIIETVSSDDNTLYTIDGSSSLGNIDWSTSTWEILGPDNLDYQTNGKSSFIFNFPDRKTDTDYTVVLNARNRATNNVVTVSKKITVGSAPIKPVIDYQVLTSNENGEIVTAKLLLSASGSLGSDIDWNNIRWNVPMAGEFGGSVAQTGVNAVYNLTNIVKSMAVEVSVTIPRRMVNETVTYSEVINIRNNEVPAIEPYITLEKDENNDLYSTTEGDVYIFSALNSKGANIDWNNVQWLVNDQYPKQGSIIRVDTKDLGEDNQTMTVTLTLRSTGGGKPVSKTLNYNIQSKGIDIVISSGLSSSVFSAGEKNIVKLSVKDSIGKNIDWERTKWMIYQGPEDIIEKYGSEIIHTFPINAKIEYYPVMVQMFFKGSTKPFVNYTQVRVQADRFTAVIKEKYDTALTEKNQYIRTFTATDSLGQNIDWQSTKWTFGDSSEYQYGPVVTHKFPYNNQINEYQVTLTVSRKTRDGQVENSIDTYLATIGKDEITPKATVTKSGEYVTFSAEASSGRGLLLDRTMWLFEGADNVNSGTATSNTNSSSSTTNTSNSYHQEQHIDISTTGGWTFGFIATLTVGGGGSWGEEWTKTHSNTNDSSYTVNQSSGESSNNIYQGALCRKMFFDGEMKKVTMVIYRALPEGTIEAESKTFEYVAGQDGQAEY